MQELKCLFAENLELDRTRFRGEIERAWNALNTGVPIVIDEVDSPELARLHLDRHGNQYHIFFVDILYGKDDKDPQGIQLITDASKLGNLLIIALSNGSRDDENSRRTCFYSKTTICKGSGKKNITRNNEVGTS
jgi:hypothetical protein